MTFEKIGRYQVERELGQGGMGAVYLARDPYMTRRVAVKVMSRELLAAPKFAERFQREAQIVATLEHSCIVPVYDFGFEDGQPFIVMRYLPAGALEKYLTSKPLPIPDVAQIFERICDALDEAHRRKIVHRDIKPANILVDMQGQAYLADFGLARVVAEARTSLGQQYMVGTPAYISPEQVLSDEPTPRSDIYSLGVVLFEMLAGRLPYLEKTPFKLYRQHTDDPVPDILQVNPDLPPDFGEIIRRAMAKKPEERFESAGQLADAVAEAGRGLLSRRARKVWMKGEIEEKLGELESDS